MKLVMCLECEDVVRLFPETPRWCQCKAVGGVYVDGVNAKVWGERAYVIGFLNSSLARAIKHRPDRADQGERFEAFVIPRESESIQMVPVPKSIKELCDGRIITE